MIAFHGYSSTTAEDILTVIANNQAAMQANGAGSKPMWDAEQAWAGSGLIGTPPMAVQVRFHFQILSSSVVAGGQPLRLVCV